MGVTEQEIELTSTGCDSVCFDGAGNSFVVSINDGGTVNGVRKGTEDKEVSEYNNAFITM